MQQLTESIIRNIHPSFLRLLQCPAEKDGLVIDYLDDAIEKVLRHKQQYKSKLCPDSPDKILKCLEIDPNKIKVVIVGQDLYPQPGVATGHAFACIDGKQPSMQILIRELEKEYGLSDLAQTFDTTLKHWTDQGVLLLNSSLSCDEYKPGSHAEYWKEFMVELIITLNDLFISREETKPIVFVLLGRQAQLFNRLIKTKWNFLIQRCHPAAETHGDHKFVGFFKEVNRCLVESGQVEISWS